MDNNSLTKTRKVAMNSSASVDAAAGNHTATNEGTRELTHMASIASIDTALDASIQQGFQSGRRIEAIAPLRAIPPTLRPLTSRSTGQREYTINFRLIQQVLPQQGESPTPFPTPQALHLDPDAYAQVVAYLGLDPRTKLIDLNQSHLLKAEAHFEVADPDNYKTKFLPVIQTFSKWVTLKDDVDNYFEEIHELIQNVQLINIVNVNIVGDLLKVPEDPEPDADFDYVDFALQAAGTAVSVVGAFITPVGVAGEIVLFAISTGIAIDNEFNDKWIPKNPNNTRVSGLIAIRQQLNEMFANSLQHADEIRESVLADWRTLNTFSQFTLPHSEERARALNTLTKAFERQVWKQLLPPQVELHYTKPVIEEPRVLLKHSDQNIEIMRAAALERFELRANELLAQRLQQDPHTPLLTIVARTGRRQLFHEGRKRRWFFVFDRFSYQLTRKNKSDTPLEARVMKQLLSSGITRRDLLEDFGLARDYPTLKPNLNMAPMNDVRYNFYSESAAYVPLTIRQDSYVLSLNRTTGNLFVNYWSPGEMASRVVNSFKNWGPILKHFTLRQPSNSPFDVPMEVVLNANPSNGKVAIYQFEKASASQEKLETNLLWSTPNWKGSTIYTPLEINGQTYLLVATPESGTVWIKQLTLQRTLIQMKDAWKTDKWKGSTVYEPLYTNGRVNKQTYVLIATPSEGKAWIKRLVTKGDRVEVQDVWSVSGWFSSTIYKPLNVGNRTMFLVASPKTGEVWIKEVIANGKTVEVVDRWKTKKWRGSSVYQSFGIDQQDYLVVSSPAEGKVWIKRLAEQNNAQVKVEPVWSSVWEPGTRDFIPVTLQHSTVPRHNPERTPGHNRSEYIEAEILAHYLLAPAIERGMAKELTLDGVGDHHDFVTNSAELFELYPNPDLVLGNKALLSGQVNNLQQPIAQVLQQAATGPELA